MFNNLSMITKVCALLATLFLVALGGAFFSASRIAMIDREYSALLDHEAPAAVRLARLNRNVTKIQAALYRAATAANDKENAGAKAMLDEALNRIDALQGELTQMIPAWSDQIRAHRATLTKLLDTGACGEVVKLGLQATDPESNAKTANKMTYECLPEMDKLLSDLVKMTDAVIAQSEKLSNELSNSAQSTQWLTVSIIGGTGILVLLVAVILTRKSISLPLIEMQQHMEEMSKGRLDRTVASRDRKDEIGAMAAALEVFRNQLSEIETMRKAQADQERLANEARKAELLSMADRLQHAVGGIVDTVSSASSQLEAAALTMQRTAGQTQSLSTAVASASEETSANVQGVASASEQLAATVSEIGRQVQDSSQIASQAVKQARETNEQMQELSTAANRIGDVVSLINTIAGQTNLLALNATIEAARAGDAGKGFAVVAQEVKTLAAQTAKATSEIASQIENMQSVTEKAVDVIRSITGTIDRMSEISGAIASAVEEQDATTKEISRNVLEAAKGTSEVAANIADVSKGAEDTGSASSQVLASAKQLSKESSALRGEVERFLSSIRAA